MATTKIQGELEIDHERGVIYFHNKEAGYTTLRIGNLPKPIPRKEQDSLYQLDYIFERRTSDGSH